MVLKQESDLHGSFTVDKYLKFDQDTLKEAEEEKRYFNETIQYMQIFSVPNIFHPGTKQHQICPDQ